MYDDPMATPALLDDLTGEIVASTEAVHWTLNGQQMTMNLSPESYAAFQEAMLPWLDASQLQTGKPGKRAGASKPEPKAPKSEIKEALWGSIPLIVSERRGGADFISQKEAAQLTRKNHGYTRCDDKLVAQIESTGGPVKIRTNISEEAAAELQLKVSTLGIQLRLEAVYYVRSEGSVLRYGTVHAELAVPQA